MRSGTRARQQPAASRSVQEFLAKLWRLSRPYFRSGERRRAWLLTALIIGLTLLTVAISAAITYWYRGFYNALQSYNAKQIWHEVGVFAALASIWVLANVMQQYFVQVLQNRWRRWLTASYIHRWMRRHTYYRMQVAGTSVDNPDQRIAQDLEFFTAQTILLPLGLLNSIASVIVFGFVLWNLSEPVSLFGTHVPGYLVWVNVAYATFGTLAVVWIGRPLFWLNNLYQRVQGDFRFDLARVRENSESIATSRGHMAAVRQLIHRFQPVFETFHRRIRRNLGVNSFSFSFNQAAVLIPVLAVLPAYLAKEIMLGGVMSVLSAFNNIQQAFAYLVDNFTSNGSGYLSLTQWIAVVDRLDELLAESSPQRPPQAAIAVTRSAAERLEIRDLDVDLPDGRRLLRELTLRVEPGARLLVSGRTGVGKSTLLRVLAGIWPYGSGEVMVPPSTMCFVPQRAYLPQATLREAIAYPRPPRLSGEELMHWLEVCELRHLAGLLDEFDAWDKRLSLGELQRVAFVRLFVTRARWNLLDEITSAIDEDLERELYARLHQALPDAAIVSIAHRSTLRRFHDTELLLEGAGEWRLQAVDPGAVRAADGRLSAV